jgi:hypothetical protein
VAIKRGTPGIASRLDSLSLSLHIEAAIERQGRLQDMQNKGVSYINHVMAVRFVFSGVE